MIDYDRWPQITFQRDKQLEKYPKSYECLNQIWGILVILSALQDLDIVIGYRKEQRLDLNIYKTFVGIY